MPFDLPVDLKLIGAAESIVNTLAHEGEYFYQRFSAQTGEYLSRISDLEMEARRNEDGCYSPTQWMDLHDRSTSTVSGAQEVHSDGRRARSVLRHAMHTVWTQLKRSGDDNDGTPIEGAILSPRENTCPEVRSLRELKDAIEIRFGILYEGVNQIRGEIRKLNAIKGRIQA
ncbi:unnamed protein product, partial [marine sediment metagenome]